MAFQIITCANKHSGKWLVIRMSDRRLVFESPSVYTCLRWVRSWGDSKGQEKAGREVSPAVAALFLPEAKGP